MSSALKKIAVTTGDTDGIGLEVAVKALLKLGPQKNFLFFLYRSDKAPTKNLKKLDAQFVRKTFSDYESAALWLAENKTSRVLIDIASPQAPPFWVERAAQLCHGQKLHGIATAPLSKELIVRCGLKDMGHTDILARVSGVKNIRMGFIGDYFNVVLATGHLPIKKVSENVTAENIGLALRLAADMAKTLKLQKKPLALLGLNPHAGERGLIGQEELGPIHSALQQARDAGLKVQGPLTPDAAFFKTNWTQFSFFVACYHDQGLIPFKMIHGQDSGCQVSLGLPFVRTSVDHGTAQDIFGQNKANPNSMISALQFCMKLIK